MTKGHFQISVRPHSYFHTPTKKTCQPTFPSSLDILNLLPHLHVCKKKKSVPSIRCFPMLQYTITHFPSFTAADHWISGLCSIAKKPSWQTIAPPTLWKKSLGDRGRKIPIGWGRRSAVRNFSVPPPPPPIIMTSFLTDGKMRLPGVMWLPSQLFRKAFQHRT